MSKKSLFEWDSCSRYIAPDIQRACWRIRKQVIQPGQVHAQVTEAQVQRAAA